MLTLALIFTVLKTVLESVNNTCMRFYNYVLFLHILLLTEDTGSVNAYMPVI